MRRCNIDNAGSRSGMGAEEADPVLSGLEKLLNEVLEPASPFERRTGTGNAEGLPVLESAETSYRALMLKVKSNRDLMLEITERLGSITNEQNELSLIVLYDLISELGSFVLENARAISKIARNLGIEPEAGKIESGTHQTGSTRRGGKTDVPMTARERQILRELLGGKTNREISLSLDINEKTVKNHLWKLYRKWGVRSRTQLFHKLVSQ
jgi:DNA-binding CsgD family transcriptional regulator